MLSRPGLSPSRDAAAEFLQAGIECFGRADKAAADAEMLALGLDATAHYGVAAPDIHIGDVALFAALLPRSICRRPGSGG